jgi:DNA-directed RNA polymerase specialized sigma24 family protein
MVVHEALVRLARRMVPTDYRDEVTQDVLVRLWKARPSSRRYTSSDGEAEAYLKTALGNRVKDIHRKNKRDRDHLVSATVDDGDSRPPDVFVERRTPEDLVIREQRDARDDALLGEAMTRLFDEAIPEIARGLQNPGGFLENIADLRAIANDDLTVDAIVEREGGNAESYVKVRNRVYQRHKRARAYLLEVPANNAAGMPRLTEWLCKVKLAFDLTQAIRRLAEEIFAARVDRGNGRASLGQDS